MSRPIRSASGCRWPIWATRYYMPLYVAPALLILVSAIRTTLKERHKAREGASKAKEV